MEIIDEGDTSIGILLSEKEAIALTVFTGRLTRTIIKHVLDVKGIGDADLAHTDGMLNDLYLILDEWRSSYE